MRKNIELALFVGSFVMMFVGMWMILPAVALIIGGVWLMGFAIFSRKAAAADAANPAPAETSRVPGPAVVRKVKPE